MDNKSMEFKRDVIKYYLENGSIRKTAQYFKIHYQTLYRWLKLYKKIKDKFFTDTYRRPWNRIDCKLEEDVITLKEKKPSITIKRTQEILQKRKIYISQHAIWSIWNRYGYSGFTKRRPDDDIDKIWSNEAQKKFSLAGQLLGDGKIEEAATVLNTIPYLPKNELLIKIPDQFLNLHRRLEKNISFFGNVPIPESIKMFHQIYNEAKEKGLLYLTIRAGLAEIALLSWKGDLKKQQRILTKMKKIFKNKKNNRRTRMEFNLYFTMLIAEGNLYIDLFEIKKAKQIARTCCLNLRRRKKPAPDLILHLARLYVRLGELKKAEYWYQQALIQISDDKKRELNAQLALNIYFIKGEYQRAMKLLRDATLPEWIRTALPLRFKSLHYLIKGNPNDAIDIAIKSLNLSKKEELPRDIFNAYLTIAAAHNVIGEKKKAIQILYDLKRYIKKFKLIVQRKMLQIILGENLEWNDGFNLPILKIGFLLKKNRYYQALYWAQKKGLLTIFYRYIFFIPEPVLNLLKKGKNTGLPKSILKLPIFNRETITFYVKFLGNLKIQRNQKFIKVKLKPKDSALLIHLSLKLNKPESLIYVDNLCNNFWDDQKTARRNLSHTLVRIKKNLNIPGHYLEIVDGAYGSQLVNQNIYFMTDYEDAIRILNQAKALERTGEWRFAKKEYLKAFSLFRGEPFKRNFDQWSVDLRHKILSYFEKEGDNFANLCLNYNDRYNASKIRKKIHKLIPDSKETEELLAIL